MNHDYLWKWLENPGNHPQNGTNMFWPTITCFKETAHGFYTHFYIIQHIFIGTSRVECFNQCSCASQHFFFLNNPAIKYGKGTSPSSSMIFAIKTSISIGDFPTSHIWLSKGPKGYALLPLVISAPERPIQISVAQRNSNLWMLPVPISHGRCKN